MKWTTRADTAHNAHWFGFKASERRTGTCGPLCKTFVKNGQKYVSHYMPHCEDTETVNPQPFVPRGTWRRGKKKGGE